MSKEKKYYNFDEIRTTIESETDKVAGTSKSIVDKPLKLTGINLSIQFIHMNAPISLSLICLVSQKSQSEGKIVILKKLQLRWLTGIAKKKGPSFWQSFQPMPI